MSKTLTMARRELASCFFSPMAYVIGAAVLLVTGVIFFFGFELIGIPRVFQAGSEASLRPLFDALAYIMIFAAPLLTMRLLSGEFDSGTIETLMTSPVSEAQVILGKFFGVLGFYVALLVGSLVFLLVMALYGQPDPGVAVMGYVGMILLGAAYLSVGVFASTLTRHQIVAAILGVAILAVLAVLMQQIVAYGGPTLGRVASNLSVMKYFRDFSRGVLDSRGVVFFLTVSALFLFLSVKTLESRRWR